jgi:putative ABC transport system substrate-binding protein
MTEAGREDANGVRAAAASRTQRRRFLVAAGMLVCVPLAAEAQPARKAYRLGFLFSGRSPRTADGSTANLYLAALLGRLQELGYAQGANLGIDARYAEGELERLPALAAELVALDVDAILAAGNPAVNAARRATQGIAIVMISADPVAAGFVPSLSRPGANLTGLTVDGGLAIWGKRLQLLKECAPAIRRVGVLSRTGGRQGAWVHQLDAVASRLGVSLVHAGTSSERDFPAAFDALAAARADALLTSDTPLHVQYRKLIIEFAARKRLPAVFAYREAAVDGGLLAYGVDITTVFRNAAVYLDKILEGARPADLPIEQPTTFELVVNLKAAKALGLTIPPSVLLSADRVID